MNYNGIYEYYDNNNTVVTKTIRLRLIQDSKDNRYYNVVFLNHLDERSDYADTLLDTSIQNLLLTGQLEKMSPLKVSLNRGI